MRKNHAPTFAECLKMVDTDRIERGLARLTFEAAKITAEKPPVVVAK